MMAQGDKNGLLTLYQETLSDIRSLKTLQYNTVYYSLLLQGGLFAAHNYLRGQYHAFSEIVAFSFISLAVALAASMIISNSSNVIQNSRNRVDKLKKKVPELKKYLDQKETEFKFQENMNLLFYWAILWGSSFITMWMIIDKSAWVMLENSKTIVIDNAKILSIVMCAIVIFMTLYSVFYRHLVKFGKYLTRKFDFLKKWRIIILDVILLLIGVKLFVLNIVSNLRDDIAPKGIPIKDITLVTTLFYALICIPLCHYLRLKEKYKDDKDKKDKDEKNIETFTDVEDVNADEKEGDI